MTTINQSLKPLGLELSHIMQLDPEVAVLLKRNHADREQPYTQLYISVPRNDRGALDMTQFVANAATALTRLGLA